MSRSVPAPMADKLLATAGELALSWDEVRTEDIAEASGIPRATLYYYFSSKDEILQFLLTRMLERLTDAVAAAEDPDAAIPDRLAAVVRAQLAHLGEFPATAQLLTANLGKAGKLPDLAAGINAAFHEPVRRLLALGAENGTLRPVDPEIAATALYGAVTVIGLRSLVIDNHLDVDEISGQILPLFWSGIRPNTRS
jgi:TetR/AcrR family transcriptional regulator